MKQRFRAFVPSLHEFGELEKPDTKPSLKCLVCVRYEMRGISLDWRKAVDRPIGDWSTAINLL